MNSIDMRMLPDWPQRSDKISQLMKDAHYECSQAAAFLHGIMRPGQWGNDVAAIIAIDRAKAILTEIEALKDGAPL